eukprot:GILI01012188.1.p1 GENE.GILI01012188.1~~GILI01012188.1.p1  ORF type:complete len:385 (+),score=54.26 GILI01012188.1:153-1157(+)
MIRQAGSTARALLDQPLATTGYTALLFAITQHCTPQVMQALLKGGASVEGRGVDNETPLYAAVFNRELELVKALLVAGANPNAKNGTDSESPLHCAARFGFVSIAEALLKGGADINMVNVRSECALFIASKANRFEMVYFLLCNDVEKHTPDRDGHSALFIASEKRFTSIVALLQADKKALREVKVREEASMRAQTKPLPSNEEIAARLVEKRNEEELLQAKPTLKSTASVAPTTATPPMEYEGEKVVRTHDPFTGKSLGPCRSLEEVGYSKPATLPEGVVMPYQGPLPRTGGTKMHIGTGTGEDFKQPPDIAAGELQGDGVETTFGIVQPIVF